MIRLSSQEAADKPQKQKLELEGLNLNSVTFLFFYAVTIAQNVQNMIISCGLAVSNRRECSYFALSNHRKCSYFTLSNRRKCSYFTLSISKPQEMVIFCTVKPQEMFIFCTVKPQEMFIFCTVCAIVTTYIEEPK